MEGEAGEGATYKGREESGRERKKKRREEEGKGKEEGPTPNILA